MAVLSVSGLRGDREQAVDNTTKGALTLLVRSLALDWSEAGGGRRCGCPLHDLHRGPGPPSPWAEKLSAACESVAPGRIGLPRDVAGAVLFLASEAASHITGPC